MMVDTVGHDNKASIQRAHDRLDLVEDDLKILKTGQDQMKLDNAHRHSELKEMLTSHANLSTSDLIRSADRVLGIVSKIAILFGFTVAGIIYLATNINAVDIAKINEKVSAFSWNVTVREAK